MRNLIHRASIALLLASPAALGACSMMKMGSSGEPPPRVEKETGCPSSPEAMGRLDWGLEPAVTLQVRNGLIASSQGLSLVQALEKDLVVPCTGLALALGVDEKSLATESKELGARAEHVCKLAAGAVTRARARAGGVLEVAASPRDCSTRNGVADECMAACGAVAPPECEGEVAGKCEGRCEGRCEYSPGSECRGECAGTCSGGCESQFQGVCSGKCEGECDGKKSKGECSGTCVGKCEEGAKGRCAGTCLGSCDAVCSLELGGTCEGICAGQCSSDLKNSFCKGNLAVSGSEGSCEMGCDALLMAGTRCAPQKIEIKVRRASNKNSARVLEEALVEHLPALITSRYQVLDYERVDRMAVHTRGAVEAMNEAMEGSTVGPDKAAKSCVKRASDSVASFDMALPSISLAGDEILEAAKAK